jgi:hypothetical protein
MDKFQYIDANGVTPLPGSKSTGWATSDAVIQRACPKCGSNAGFLCETKGGRKTWPPHSQRIVMSEDHRVY